jgi:hypothetical protein
MPTEQPLSQPLTQLNLQSLSRRTRSGREHSASDNLSEITSASSIESLPRLQINGQYYVLERYLHNKRSRHSWVWSHGTAVVELSTKAVFWSCDACDEKGHPRLYSAATTSTADTHLKAIHKLQPIGAGDSEEPEEITSRSTIESCFQHPSMDSGS